MFETDEVIDLEMFQADGPGHANTMPQDEVTQTGMSQREMLGTELFGIEVTGSWMLIVRCCLHMFSMGRRLKRKTRSFV